MDRKRWVNVLGHLPLLALALVAILSMTQACSSGSSFVGGPYGSSGYGSSGYGSSGYGSSGYGDGYGDGYDGD